MHLQAAGVWGRGSGGGSLLPGGAALVLIRQGSPHETRKERRRRVHPRLELRVSLRGDEEAVPRQLEKLHQLDFVGIAINRCTHDRLDVRFVVKINNSLPT